MTNLSNEEKQTQSTDQETIEKNKSLDQYPFYINQLKERKFSVEKSPPNLRYVLSKVNGDKNMVGIASKGEIVVVYGPPKSRKSTLLSCIVASAFVNEPNYTLDFHMNLSKDENILFIDTEMPFTSFYRRQMLLNKMCGSKHVDISTLHAYSLKPFSPGERVDQIEYLIETTPNLGLVVIDQIADLVPDINDRESVLELYSRVSRWTDSTGAILLTSIHVTRGTEYMTGVLGHEFSKKMDSGFFITKDSLTKRSKVTHLIAREQDVDDFLFSHNEWGEPEYVGFNSSHF